MFVGGTSFFFSDTVLKILVNLHLFSSRWLHSDTESKNVTLGFAAITILLAILLKTVVKSYIHSSGKDDPLLMIQTKKRPCDRDYAKLSIRDLTVLSDKDFSYFENALTTEMYQQIMKGPRSEYVKLLIMAWVFKGVPLDRAIIKVEHDLARNAVPEYFFKFALNTKEEQPA